MNKYRFLNHPDGKLDIVDAQVTFTDKIEPGFYKAETISLGFVSTCNIYKDDSIQIPKSAYDIAREYIDIKYINTYFSPKSTDLHNKLDIKQKLGLLLYGKQGTGKTTGCYAIAQELINTKGAIVVTVKDYHEYKVVIGFLEKAKAKIHDFLSITIFDECEDEMYQREPEFKRLLDSSNSLNNHISFFTTNHVNRIPETIRDRPSRIKFSTRVDGIENEETIFTILTFMNEPIDSEVKLSDDEIKSIVRELKGKTLDEIKNAFIDKTFEINFQKKVIKPELEISKPLYIDLNEIQ